MSENRVYVRIEQGLKKAFQTRSKHFGSRYSQVLRALLVQYAAGLAKPEQAAELAALIDEEHSRQKTIVKSPQARRLTRLYVRLDPTLYAQLHKRLGETGVLAPVVRAVIRQFCSGKSDPSAFLLENERRWGRNRRNRHDIEPTPKRRRTAPQELEVSKSRIDDLLSGR